MFSSHDVGMWMPGNPSSFSFEPGMEQELMLFKARQIYRIVSVIQPPFMMWNETKRKSEKFAILHIIEIFTEQKGGVYDFDNQEGTSYEFKFSNFYGD